MLDRLADWLHDADHRVRMAKALLLGSVVGWPLTALTVFRDEPQGILGLSWLGVILIALDILATSDVRREVEADA